MIHKKTELTAAEVEYDQAKLKTLSIYELRNIARIMGINKPFFLSREDVIEEISSAQAPRYTSFSIANALAQMEDTDVYQMAQSQREKEYQIVTGYIYIIPRGHGMLITGALNNYHVPGKVVSDFNLKSGDYIEASVVDNVVCEVTKITQATFDIKKTAHPTRVRTLGGTEFKLGDRVILTSENHFNFIEYIIKHRVPNTCSIALLIDQTDDCVDYLRASGFDEVYLARVTHTPKRKTLQTISALIAAKHEASSGKDVVLYIDSLNKIFRLYNSAAMPGTVIDVTQVNVAYVTDLKTYFLETRQLVDGGSLTIVTHMSTPSTEAEKFVMDDFRQLASTVVNVDKGNDKR